MKESKTNSFKRVLAAVSKNWMEAMKYYSYSA